MRPPSRIPGSWRAFLLALLALLAAGCVVSDKPTRFQPTWEKVDFTAPGWEQSRKVLLVADCQLHNLLSKALPDRNLSIEAVAGTAIRPPQLDLFAADVLAFITREATPDVEAILHLGDAIDLACEGEFETFAAVMDAAGKPWLMAPGNHDCFYFGSYDPQDPELWDMACHAAGQALPKDRYIRLYVAALVRQPAFADLARALGLQAAAGESLGTLAGRIPDRFEWRNTEPAHSLLASIHWQIEASRPWESFVVQEVDLTPDANAVLRVRTLLLDSCQYARRPELLPNGWRSYPVALNCGLTGDMQPEQLRVVRNWIEAGAGRHSFTLMCHHPFASLAPRARAALGWLWRLPQVGGMVSAHTHAGFMTYHDLGDTTEEVEINLASTTDWPMEWRTFQACVHPAEKRAFVRVPRFTLVDELRRRDGYFEHAWEIPRGAADDYREYRVGQAANSLLFEFYFSHHIVPPWLRRPSVRANQAAVTTETKVKDTLLWTYQRLLREFPTDPGAAATWPAECRNDADVLARIDAAATAETSLDTKIEVLGQLSAFERTRKTRNPRTGEPLDAARVRFKLSQAGWSARYESSSGRRLRVEDDLIRIEGGPGSRIEASGK